MGDVLGKLVAGEIEVDGDDLLSQLSRLPLETTLRVAHLKDKSIRVIQVTMDEYTDKQ